MDDGNDGSTNLLSWEDQINYASLNEEGGQAPTTGWLDNPSINNIRSLSASFSADASSNGGRAAPEWAIPSNQSSATGDDSTLDMPLGDLAGHGLTYIVDGVPPRRTTNSPSTANNTKNEGNDDAMSDYLSP